MNGELSNTKPTEFRKLLSLVGSALSLWGDVLCSLPGIAGWGTPLPPDKRERSKRLPLLEISRDLPLSHWPPEHIMLFVRAILQGVLTIRSATEPNLSYKTALKWWHQIQAQAETYLQNIPLSDEVVAVDEMFQTAGKKVKNTRIWLIYPAKGASLAEDDIDFGITKILFA